MYGYKEIKGFLDRITISEEDIHPEIKEMDYAVKLKGYGTPEMEMKFLHDFFMYITKDYPDFEKFSWEQTNAYNDEYYHFSLQLFEVNDIHDVEGDIDFYFLVTDEQKIKTTVYIMPNDYPNEDEIQFAKEHNLEFDDVGLVKEEDMESFFHYYEKKYKHLRLPSLKILALLKLLELSLSSYYFLYVFGNGVRVELTKEGVKVIDLLGNQDGKPLGEGIYLGNIEDL